MIGSQWWPYDGTHAFDAAGSPAASAASAPHVPTFSPGDVVHYRTAVEPLVVIEDEGCSYNNATLPQILVLHTTNDRGIVPVYSRNLVRTTLPIKSMRCEECGAWLVVPDAADRAWCEECPVDDDDLGWDDDGEAFVMMETVDPDPRFL